MTTSDTDIRPYIAQMAGMRRAHGPVADARYSSYDELVLDQGIAFPDPDPTLPLPDRVKRGEMKNCYENALLGAIANRDLFYVEGYAASTLVGLPVLHAWLVDEDGNVYDPTWTEGGTYYGVPLDLDWAVARIVKTEYYGILANDWMARKTKPLYIAGFPKKAIAEPWRKEIGGRPKVPNAQVEAFAAEIRIGMAKAAALTDAG